MPSDVWGGTVINVLTDSLAVNMLVIDGLADVLVDIGVDMSPDVKIIVVALMAITVEFAVPVSNAVDMLCGAAIDVFIEALTDVLAGVIISVVTGIGADVMVDVNVNTLAAVTTDFEFVTSVPLGKSILLC